MATTSKAHDRRHYGDRVEISTTGYVATARLYDASDGDEALTTVVERPRVEIDGVMSQFERGKTIELTGRIELRVLQGKLDIRLR